MEDHMNTCRIGVTAAFCRCIPNYPTDPPVEATYQDIFLYHAMPYGLQDGLRRPITPDFFVDITSVIDDKERMLACHEGWRRHSHMGFAAIGNDPLREILKPFCRVRDSGDIDA
jgi:LmbE family N-acetylglucosaminyl deacetylase